MIDPAVQQALMAADQARRRGDPGAALRAIEALPAAARRRPEVLHLEGLARKDSGDIAGARASLARAVELSGGRPEIRNSLGNLLEEAGEADEADRQFAAAIASHPSFLPAWINRGRLASVRGRHAEAVEWLEKARALDPRSSLALVTLGNALRRAGEHERAIEILGGAAAMEPGKASTRLHLASALRAADRQREAIAEYDSAERAGQLSPQLLENRAGAWLDLGEVEKARTDIDRMVALFPAYLDGHRARARLYWEWGLEGDPFDSYRQVAAAFPREPSVWHAWVNALISFRQHEPAIDAAERAEAAVGWQSGIAAAKAIALGETGRLAESKAEFERCASAFGDAPLFLNAFARHLLRSGEAGRAAELMERALRSDPDNQMSWAYLGTAWRMLGDERELWLHDYERHVVHVEAAPPGFEGGGERFAQEAADTLRGLHRTRIHPADQTLRGGTQTPGALFDRREPAVRAIREAVLAAAARFASTLPDDPGHPFLRRKSANLDFSGSWSVRLMRQGFHVNHVHERGWISSAFYFALPPAAGEDDPHAGWLQLGEPPAELGLDLPPRRLIEPRVGTLALFPSSMWHGTVPFLGEGERLTAAFDIVPAR